MNSSQATLNSAQRQRRLDQAIEYVARAWFPANPEVLTRIKTRAEAGEYNDAFDVLLNDLKSDFSIFTYLLKELREHYPPDSDGIDPITLMRSLDISRLISMISVSSDAISRHSFMEMEKAQAARLKHFILGCSTSEMLADSKGGELDPEQIFTLAAVRQLGLNLVAWNYPSIYGRVLQSLKDGAPGELDAMLADQLGFEPIQLASALTLPAQVRQQFASELGLPVKKAESSPDEKALVARKLCEIGEAFAILNDPENYPTGSAQSHTSIQEIESILGPGGIERIHAAAHSRYVSYLTISPDITKLSPADQKAVKEAGSAYGRALSLRNPYLSRLPEQFRDHITEVYRLVKKGQVSTDGIQKLATEVLPQVGFPRGCIYLIEQHDLTLSPRLRIGQDSVKRYRPVSCLDHSETGNPVVDSFSCSYPIKQMNCLFLGQRVSLIAGVLGVSERAGVLYLEMSDALVQDMNIDILGVYKAFRQCMNDCLNLR